MVNRKSVVVFDYGFGNVRSACRAFEEANANVELTNDISKASKADGLIIPGVGAFDPCMSGLRAAHGAEIIAERLTRNKPIFGICVGHQVFFEGSTEGADSWRGEGGLNIFKGYSEKLHAKIIPHMGWNTVSIPQNTRISAYFNSAENERFYFVHSYAVSKLQDSPISKQNSTYSNNNVSTLTTQHENSNFISAIASNDGLIFGTQFHPEKSGKAGLTLIQNWLDKSS